MSFRPSVLCPIDFSDSSRGALRYAVAITAHFGARLTLLAVNDPLLQEADEIAGVAHLTDDTMRDMERFVAETFASRPHGVADVRLEVTTGKPAPEILRVSREKACDLIVMSSHGLTGFRKLFFGSTTERVLRETSVPVLVTPGTDAGLESLEEVRKVVRRVMAPVDLSAATPHQLRIARGLAEGLDVPLLILHIVEPVRVTASALSRVPKSRRNAATGRAEPQACARRHAHAIKAEVLIAYGEPAEEIAKVGADRDAGIIVMGLHSSPVLGPRMGSVTYRVCAWPIGWCWRCHPAGRRATHTRPGRRPQGTRPSAPVRPALHIRTRRATCPTPSRQSAEIEWMRRIPPGGELVDRDHWTSILVIGRYEEVRQDPAEADARVRAEQLFRQRHESWLPGAAKLESGEHPNIVVYRIQINRLTGRRAARDRA